MQATSRTAVHPNDVRALGAVAMAGIVAFAAVAAWMQAHRGELDAWRMTLSFYLLGPQGRPLVAAYWALAVGLLALAAGYARALRHVDGIVLPAILLALGGVSLAAVTVFPTDTLHGPRTLTGLEHNLCASAAFLCVGVAMLRLSWQLRRAPAWHRRAPAALALAALAFAALWVDVLWRALPRGAAQKAVIALYLLWLALAAWWLIRRPRYT